MGEIRPNLLENSYELSVTDSKSELELSLRDFEDPDSQKNHKRCSTMLGLILFGVIDNAIKLDSTGTTSTALNQ